MPHGNSIVAGVVLVGVLGTLAVALQSQGPAAQVAHGESQAALGPLAGGTVTPTLKPKETKTDGSETTPCLEGWNYKIVRKEGKNETECTRVLSCFNDRPGTKRTDGGKETTGGCKEVGSPPPAKSKGPNIADGVDRRCDDVPGKSFGTVEYCAAGIDGKTRCVKAGICEEGKNISPQIAQARAASGFMDGLEKKNLTNKQLEDYRALAKADPSFNQIFKSTEDLKAAELKGVAQEVQDIDTRLKQIADPSYNCGLAASGAVAVGVNCGPEFDRLMAEREGLVAEGDALSAQLKQLSSAQVALVPPKGPGEATIFDTGYSQSGYSKVSSTFYSGPYSYSPSGSGIGSVVGGMVQQLTCPPLGSLLGTCKTTNPFTGQNPYIPYQYQTPYEQCYYGQSHVASNGSQYCSNGAIYSYNSMTCQYQLQQQCRNGCAQPTGVYSTQCAPSAQTTANAPTASISCEPGLADVGAEVFIEYSCKNAVSSAGIGFDTEGDTSGTAEVMVEKAPKGTTALNLGLICTGENGQTTSAEQCVVQINKPSIIMTANPVSIILQDSDESDNDDSDERSVIGWVTTGMESCTISSPDLPDFTEREADRTNVNGTAPTPPLADDAQFVLVCMTAGGSVKSATTTVFVEG